MENASVTAIAPYRRASQTAGDAAPSEFVYRFRKADRLVTVTRAVAQVGLVGALLIVVSHIVGFESVTPLLVVGTVVLGTILWRRAANTPFCVILRVEDRVVDVSRRASRTSLHPASARATTTLLRVGIERIAHVGLDTKTIRRVQQGNAITPALRFIDLTVGPEFDVARIFFDVDGIAAPLHLTDAYLAHLESVEWLGKMRSFLRSHGWVPEDEREEDVE
jgi:hypothetical protein